MSASRRGSRVARGIETPSEGIALRIRAIRPIESMTDSPARFGPHRPLRLHFALATSAALRIAISMLARP